MKIFLPVLIAFILGALIAPAFNPISSLIEQIRNGFVAGVEACTKARASELIETSALRKYCIDKHETELFSTFFLSGRAYFTNYDINGSIRNEQPDMVITELEIRAAVFDSEGNETASNATADVWILPNGEADFEAKFDDPSAFSEVDLEWCPRKPDDVKTVSCKTWDILRAKGVRF